MRNEKILVTGPAGQIGLPLVRHLARDNEVWGLARFADPTARGRVEAAGAVTCVADIGTGDFRAVPTDFTYVVHLASFMGPGRDFDHALRVNGEGTGLLLQHCREAKAALVMSTQAVYEPNPDPLHPYAETDAIGDAHGTTAPTYSISKIAEEVAARTAARMLDLPVVITRMNVAYGDNGGLPAHHLRAMRAGQPVHVRWDPSPHSPIHEDDIAGQLDAMLRAASVPATIVNWCGDDAVDPQEWCGLMAELTGLEPKIVVQEVPGAQRGLRHDPAKRLSITGPCRVSWREGITRMVESMEGDA